ncbi:MAG: alpha/beta hydrolase [Actinomycetota bacterium]
MDHIDAPDPRLLDERRRPANPALELRAPVELAAFVAANPALQLAPRGDGRPVLVLPGFVASDSSTVPLRTLLRQLGHRPYGWGLGRNLGPTPDVVVGLQQLLVEASDAAGGPVPIVGWSLGGVYGRYLSMIDTDRVSQVISLGSPFNIGIDELALPTPLWDALAEEGDFVHDRGTIDLDRIPVPSTAVYSRTDGVVAWRSCIQTPRRFAENVEVCGSHIGLGVSVSVALVIADRLAQTDDRWRPFEKRRTRAPWLFPRRRSPFAAAA